MSTKLNHRLRMICLLVLIVSLLPSSHAGALDVSSAPPPVDMFQLPWDQGIAWVAIDGIDNGTKRPLNSSHYYKVGGAIDFAPRAKMVTGEDTSKFWVAAAAAGTVVERTSCSVRLAHENGWLTEYQFLGSIQVKLGDVVARNQRLGIIADGVRQKYCPGYSEINVPHLHFMLRPSMVDASFAGWVVNYNRFFNTTSFTKNGTTFGLYKPLMNVMDSASTPTPTPSPTNTPIGSPTTQPSPTPTLSGPYVSTAVNPSTFNVGETALATVSLNNVPQDGYTSAEFTCSYNASLFEVSNITVASLFGDDAATAINDPQNGSFIVAIAGSNGNKATTSGPVFTFNMKGLQPVQMYFGCTARVSTGNNLLTEIPATNVYISVVGESTATPNLTPSITPSPSQAPMQDTPTPGVGVTDTPAPTHTPGGIPTTPAVSGVAYSFAEQACVATWFSGAGQLPCPGIDGDDRGFVLLLSNPRLENGITDTRPGLLTNPQNVTNGYIQGIYPSFRVQDGDRFRAIINCEYGAVNCYAAFRLDYQIGSGPIQTFWGPFLERFDGIGYSPDIDLNQLAGQDVKFILTVLASGPATGDRAQWVNPHIYRSSGIPTAVPTVTAGGNWLNYTNQKYGFQFGYPETSQIVSGATDNYVRFNLPYTQGTNIGEKYLEVTVQENPALCQSPLATSSMLETSETIVYGGISYLVQTGQDGSAGHTNKWTAYSTMRDGACVSLSFVIRAANPGMFATPPPVYDEAFETAVYGQIVTTYMWLAMLHTPTPTFTPASVESATPTSATPSSSPTPVPGGNGILAGQVTASKPATINLYDATNTLIGTTTVASNGTFSLNIAPGTYTVVAVADGYLDAQGSVTITAGNTTTASTITLVAGDIDGNNKIDQFDALTIGMSYNASTPGSADLNNDGIINVLDLERLAKNYRQTGPTAW